MTTKERILALLEENRGTPLSGEVLAEELGVSRTAVWKAIKDLQKAGHAIAAAQNRGYTLDTDSEVLSEQGVRLFLRNKSLNLVVAQELESTNLTAKQMAAAGAPHGTLVVADSQTAGRGRRGRSFASPPGTGLYLSMVLRSALPMQSAVLVTSAAAVAVCRAVERAAGKRLDIKWVNDLFYRGKKCCGILTEAAADVETGGVDYLVVGIGLNLLPPEGGWPEELSEIAASIFTPGEHVGRCRIAAAIADELLALCTALPDTSFMAEYRARNLVPGRGRHSKRRTPAGPCPCHHRRRASAGASARRRAGGAFVRGSQHPVSIKPGRSGTVKNETAVPRPVHALCPPRGIAEKRE